MKKIVLAVLVLLLAAAALLAYFAMQGPDLAEYEHLKNPAISTRPSQKMIVVEAVGDPNVVGEKVFELLFDLYYSTDGVERWTLPAARARWPVSPDLPKEEWNGIYGIPVPDSVMMLPDHTPVSGMTVSLTTWEYGEVAELLHVGPYDRETPSIEKLKAFISERGYETSSPHEEEYLKGPGMFFRGNPEEYVTILRYEIRPVMDLPLDEDITAPSDGTIVEVE